MNLKLLLLAIIIGASWSAFTLSFRQTWLAPYDVAYWQDIFENSQLVRGDKARNFMSDYDVYAIIGYKYWHGDNPLQLHTEAPPLGKQMIGLGIELFKNQNVMSLILGTVSLLLVYVLSRQVIGSAVPAAAVTLLLSIDPQYREMMLSSNLDIPQLFWLLVSVNCFVAGLKRPKWFYLANFSLGLFMVTKIYFSGLVVLAVYFGYLFLLGNFTAFISYVATLIFLPLGYILPYVPGLIYQPNLLNFIRFQRWLTSWWAGSAQAKWGGIFSVIFTARWLTWWDNSTVKVANWSLLWPLTTVAAVVSGIKLIRHRTPALVIWLLVIMLLLFLSFTSFFPRYLVLILPFTYLLSVYLLANWNK